ncbi:MAG: cell division protein FtsQ/DivIB [Nitrospiria bacterium]
MARNDRRLQPNRKKRRRSIFSAIRKVLWVLLLAGGVVAGGVAAYSWLNSLPYFKVEEIRVTGLNYLREDRIMTHLQGIRHQSLFQINLNEVQKELESDPWVRSVRLKKHFPDIIEVLVAEKQPVCYLREGGHFYLSDEEGRYIDKVGIPFKNIPELKGVQVEGWIRRKDKEAGLVMRALEFLQMAAKPHFLLAREELSAVEMKSGEDLAATIGGTTFLFRYPFAPGQWFRFLSVKNDILARNIMIENIDLRFAGKVIVRPQKEKT